MHARKKGMARRLVPLVLLMSFTWAASLYPQFLEDEEEKAPDDMARSITAETPPAAPDGSCVIRVRWQLNPQFAGEEYIVAKSDSVIDTAEKVRAARVIATVKGAEQNSFDDSGCVPGSYYYVVLSKKSIVENRMGLFRDGNYTGEPAVIGARGEDLLVAGIAAAEIEKFKIRLAWVNPDMTGVYYYIYRSREAIDSVARLDAADKLGTVTDAEEFLDEGITEPGDYYYAVTARSLKGKENRSLVPGANFTTQGVAVRLSAPAPETVAITSISARAGGDGVIVGWNFTGRGEGNMHRLFRSAKLHTASGEVTDGEVLQEIDISRREYRDPVTLPGAYYYGLVPSGAAGSAAVELVPGVNITRTPVVIKERIKRPEIKIDLAETDDIDRILRRTFFKGKYRNAIKELLNLLRRTDNKGVTAKAGLFIGRSYIELGEYRKSLDYLFAKDVKAYFPKQSAFWQDFALTRLKNY